MKNIYVESTSKDFSISNNVLGYSGVLSKNRENESDAGSLLKVNYEKYICMLYHNPALLKAHKPQDSIGLFINSQTIKFAIADGVTIVDGKVNNDSGNLSFNLIQQLPLWDINNWENEIEVFLKEYLNSSFTGASTLSLGSIDLENSSLAMLFVGNHEDMGLSEIYQKGEFKIIPNNSYGFLPKHFKKTMSNIPLHDAFCLVLSSDGVTIDRKDIIDIVEHNYLSKPAFNLLGELEKRIIKTRDDESMIIIQKVK